MMRPNVTEFASAGRKTRGSQGTPALHSNVVSLICKLSSGFVALAYQGDISRYLEEPNCAFAICLSGLQAGNHDSRQAFGTKMESKEKRQETVDVQLQVQLAMRGCT